LRELETRRATILDAILGQGKLTENLEAKIAHALTKTELEDIYLPFRPKRRTRAEIARERGLLTSRPHEMLLISVQRRLARRAADAPGRF
jgi:transcriptional accessory protein Tex/SPT6